MAGCPRDACHVGGGWNSCPIGPVRPRVSLIRGPPTPSKNKTRRADSGAGEFSMPAESECRGCQFRAVAVPFPFLGQGHLHSWVHCVQFLYCPALYSEEPVLEGAVLVCDSESQKSLAKESDRGQGPQTHGGAGSPLSPANTPPSPTGRGSNGLVVSHRAVVQGHLVCDCSPAQLT